MDSQNLALPRCDPRAQSLHPVRDVQGRNMSKSSPAGPAGPAGSGVRSQQQRHATDWSRLNRSDRHQVMPAKLQCTYTRGKYCSDCYHRKHVRRPKYSVAGLYSDSTGLVLDFLPSSTMRVGCPLVMKRCSFTISTWLSAKCP